MDAKTIFQLLKPQLETMEDEERKTLSKLIIGEKRRFSRRIILSVKEAKEKIKLYRSVEIIRERQKSVAGQS